MKTLSTLLTYCLAMVIAIPGQSQHEPSENLQTFVDKKMHKKGMLLNPGHRLKEKAGYEKPKKIGILVFGVVSTDKYTGHDTWHRYYESLSEAGASVVAQALHDVTIPAIKESYATQNVELYTVNEYLDTDEKRAAYQNMDMRIMGMAKLSEGFANPDEMGLPNGYKFFNNCYYHGDIGGRADIIDELKMFGMDGYISIFIEFYGPNTLYNVHTNMMVFKDRDYVSKAKKETYKRMDLAGNVLPMGTTGIEASCRYELRAERKKKRDVMVDFVDGQVWIDPNLPKVVAHSANLYFPFTK